MSKGHDVVPFSVELQAKLRSDFAGRKKELGDLPVTNLTVSKMCEVMEYVSGKHDPTPTSSNDEVLQGVRRMYELLLSSRPEPSVGLEVL